MTARDLGKEDRGPQCLTCNFLLFQYKKSLKVMITEIKGHPKPYKGLGTKGQTYKPKMSLDLLCSHKSSGQESGGLVSFYVAYQSGGEGAPS